MIGTSRLILARAARAYRQGLPCSEQLGEPLSPAQVGAAYRLQQLGAVELIDAAQTCVEKIMSNRLAEFGPTYRGDEKLPPIYDVSVLEQTLGEWLQVPDDTLSQARIGYWLMSAFTRGLDRREAALLTRFLAEGGAGEPALQSTRSVRRYPTGGVSEKQALILPAFLRCLARQLNCCSSFLVARRLAHTGGTQDKLAALPGARFVTHAQLQSWDGVHPPVQYFSAGPDFCPRDAMLYRIRSDTGTVSDPGLMAASIMAKQIAFPANIIILDVLFGDVAFLQSRAEAEQFTGLCDEIAKEHSLQLHPFFRQSRGAAARYIGNIVEVYEVANTLYNAIGVKNTYSSLADETKLAVDFMCLFGTYLGADPVWIKSACLEALHDGLIFSSLIDLWAEHGVQTVFLEQVRREPGAALLRGLSTTTVHAPQTGEVIDWNVIAIADLVNHRLNAYQYSLNGVIDAVTRGGVKILVSPGDSVAEGDALAILYSEAPLVEETVMAFQKLFYLKPIDSPSTHT